MPYCQRYLPDKESHPRSFTRCGYGQSFFHCIARDSPCQTSTVGPQTCQAVWVVLCLQCPAPVAAGPQCPPRWVRPPVAQLSKICAFHCRPATFQAAPCVRPRFFFDQFAVISIYGDAARPDVPMISAVLPRCHRPAATLRRNR